MAGKSMTDEHANTTPIDTVGRARLWIWGLLLVAVSLPDTSEAFDKRLALGVGGGYSQLFRAIATDPTSAYGGGGNVHLTYGFDDAFGITAQYRMAWFGSYTPLEPYSTTDEDGEPVVVYQYGQPVSELTVWDAALCLVYAIDVMRAVPYIAVGAVGARIAERRGPADLVDYELGLRTDLGFDFMLLKHMSLGASAGMDTFFTGASGYVSTFSFLVRASLVFDLCELGRGEDTD
jgi:hypothetical protein